MSPGTRRAGEEGHVVVQCEGKLIRGAWRVKMACGDIMWCVCVRACAGLVRERERDEGARGDRRGRQSWVHRF